MVMITLCLIENCNDTQNNCAYYASLTLVFPVVPKRSLKKCNLFPLGHFILCSPHLNIKDHYDIFAVPGTDID